MLFCAKHPKSFKVGFELGLYYITQQYAPIFLDRSKKFLQCKVFFSLDRTNSLLCSMYVALSILLFESLGVLWVLLYPTSRPNHTSYRKIYFNEFVANVLNDNMDIIIFDNQGCGDCQRPKTSYLGAHSMFGSSHNASSTKDSMRLVAFRNHSASMLL